DPVGRRHDLVPPHRPLPAHGTGGDDRLLHRLRRLLGPPGRHRLGLPGPRPRARLAVGPPDDPHPLRPYAAPRRQRERDQMAAAEAAARGGAAPSTTRRNLLAFAGWGTMLVITLQATIAFIVFFWPRKLGTFGGPVSAGSPSDYQVGDVKYFVEG